MVVLLILVPDLSDSSFSLLSEVLDLITWLVSKIFYTAHPGSLSQANSVKVRKLGFHFHKPNHI